MPPTLMIELQSLYFPHIISWHLCGGVDPEAKISCYPATQPQEGALALLSLV